MSERLRLLLERAQSGYRLRDAATGEVVRWEDPRILVDPGRGRVVSGRIARRSVLRAGAALALVPEPDNEHDPNAVAVWNEEQTLQVGYVPRETAPQITGDEQAVSLWRVEGGLRVLIAPADAWVGRRAIDSAAVAYEFKLPDLGEGLTEGEVARWLVSEGDEVAEDQPLVEIQTDKTTVEIPSPAAGKVASILVEEGKVVPVGTILVVIGEDGAVPPSPSDSPRQPADRAASTGTGPCTGPGTCPCDAARAAARPGARRRPRFALRDRPAGTCDRSRRASAASRGSARDLAGGTARAAARGSAADRRAHDPRPREVPPVTWVEECDFGGLDLKLLLPTVLKACAEALKEFPELNARLEGDEIVYLDRYDLGVAVQTDDGLVVPVVRGCDSASIDELADEVARLAEGARAGTLKPEELRGSTFTVTSAGKLAGLFQTPIVNHPEVAILSIGRIADRPVVREGELAVAQIGYVALTFDHRVVDGARAAEFGLAVIRRLEAAGLKDEEPGRATGLLEQSDGVRLAPCRALCPS